MTLCSVIRPTSFCNPLCSFYTSWTKFVYNGDVRLLGGTLLILLTMGCGRFGFGGQPGDSDGDFHDAGFEENEPFPESTSYISPTGDDGNPGTLEAPWKTWGYALSQMTPGDTLVAQDGVYGSVTGTGLLNFDCREASTACEGAPCPSGTPDLPITVRAVNERMVFLRGLGGWPPVFVWECAHIVLEGLYADNVDAPAVGVTSEGQIVSVINSNNVVLRRLLGTWSNRYINSFAYYIGNSTDVLVEECEVYAFHKIGMLVWESNSVTLRRNYVNAREVRDLPEGYDTGCPNRACSGIHVSGSDDVVLENNISEGSVMGLQTSWSRRVTFRGNIALNSTNGGFFMSSDCQGNIPCTNQDRIAKDLLYVDNVAVGNRVGFWSRGAQDVTIQNGTAIENEDLGYAFDLVIENAGLAASASAIDSHTVAEGGTGFSVTDHATWSIDNANAYGHLTAYRPLDNVTGGGEEEPGLGSCRVYVPAGSLLKGAGLSTPDIGANIIYRSVDNILTVEKLWNQATGAFSCGTTTLGLNDGSFPSCVNVHKRLNVGENGCPVP